MTKRYYYDCAIEALYMLKNFGVKFECICTPEETQEYDGIESFDFLEMDLREPNTVEDLINELENNRKIYVHPDSMQVFEQQAEDVLKLLVFNNIYSLSVIKLCVHTGTPDSHHDYIKEELGEEWEIKDWRIIARENKPFIWPKEE